MIYYAIRSYHAGGLLFCDIRGCHLKSGWSEKSLVTHLSNVSLYWSYTNLMSLTVYQVRQKSNPLKLFAVFSATAWNFCVKFYLFSWLSYRHLSAKSQHCVRLWDRQTDSCCDVVVVHAVTDNARADVACVCVRVRVCADVDECRAGSGWHQCPPTATCQNVVGQYLCHCAYGFYGDHHTCHRQSQSSFLPCAMSEIQYAHLRTSL